MVEPSGLGSRLLIEKVSDFLKIFSRYFQDILRHFKIFYFKIFLRRSRFSGWVFLYSSSSNTKHGHVDGITIAKQTNEQTKNKERGMQMEFEYDVSGSVGLLL